MFFQAITFAIGHLDDFANGGPLSAVLQTLPLSAVKKHLMTLGLT